MRVWGTPLQAHAVLARSGDNPLLVATATTVPAHLGESEQLQARGRRWVKPGANIKYLRAARGNKGEEEQGGGRRFIAPGVGRWLWHPYQPT